MRVERRDDEVDVGHMVEYASTTWIGGNARVGQSRWGAAAEQGRQLGRAVKLSGAAEAVEAVIFRAIERSRQLGRAVKLSGAAEVFTPVMVRAAERSPQLRRAVKLSAPAVAFTAVIFVSVVLAAVAVTPGGTAKSGTNGVGHLFAGRAVASPSQAPATSVSSRSPSRVAPRTGTAPSSGPSSTPRPTDE
jgi:hypothetical protein